MAKALAVLLYDRLAGELTRDNGRLTFRYDPSYTADLGATPLSLSMPLEQPQHGHAVVEPFLLGLLPDNDAVLRRWARTFGVRPNNPFALLAYVGEDCAGAVQFVRPDRVDQLGAGGVEWLDEAQVAERLRQLRQDPTAWQLTGSTGQFSLAGAQAKTALHFDGSRWGVPTGRIPTTHILKPAIAALDDHDLNEHLCLDLAHRLGLTAARSRIGDFAGERALVVSRYDRMRTDEGTWQRVHQEDMCQALGVRPDHKYQSEGGPSPEQIGMLLRSTAPPDGADAAVAAFVDALALNWVLAGTDAHAKNYSILLSGGAVRLAPLYDLASALPYGDIDQHRLVFPMRIGGEYALSYLGRSNWVRLAAAVGLDPDETVDRIADIAARTPDALAAACAAPEVVALGRPMPDRLLAAVRDRALRCADRLAAGTAQHVPTGRTWTVRDARTLFADLAEPQRRLVQALVDADGAVAAAHLPDLLGPGRTSLRGLTGPITKALQRLEQQGVLPAGLPRPVRSRYGEDQQGVRRLEALEIAPGALDAWAAALAKSRDHNP